MFGNGYYVKSSHCPGACRLSRNSNVMMLVGSPLHRRLGRALAISGPSKESLFPGQGREGKPTGAGSFGAEPGASQTPSLPCSEFRFADFAVSDRCVCGHPQSAHFLLTPQSKELSCVR